MTFVARWRRTSALAAATFASAGLFGHAASDRGGAAARGLSPAPVELTVDNKSSLDITIFVVHDSRTDRLDRVEAVRKKRIVIPSRMIGVLGDFRLVGEREGAREGFGARIITQSVTPQECQRVEWTIEARLELSSLGVFPKDPCD